MKMSTLVLALSVAVVAGACSSPTAPAVAPRTPPAVANDDDPPPPPPPDTTCKGGLIGSGTRC